MRFGHRPSGPPAPVAWLLAGLLLFGISAHAYYHIAAGELLTLALEAILIVAFLAMIWLGITIGPRSL